MPKDPSKLGFYVNKITVQELTVMITVIVVLSTGLDHFVSHEIKVILAAETPVLMLLLLWIHAKVVNRAREEFKQKLPTWQERRFYAALHFRGHHRPPNTGPDDVAFMLDQLNSICEHDSVGLVGRDFFRQNVWWLLKLYWIYAHERIIEEQKWPHIFPTYRKYRDKFGDHETDDPHGWLLRRELNETDPSHGLW